jgi:hypothetical protein
VYQRAKPIALHHKQIVRVGSIVIREWTVRRREVQAAVRPMPVLLEIICAPTPTGRRPSIAAPASSLHVGRAHPVGVALARLARLALGHSYRQTGHGDRLASRQFPLVLDLEKPTSHRAPGRAASRPRASPGVVHRESLVGCPSDSRRLLKVGIAVSQSTVAKYMRRHRRPPSQTWHTFLTNHASQSMAADLFVVPTVTFQLLFVLVILRTTAP